MTDLPTLAPTAPAPTGLPSIREIIENRRREMETIIADYDIGPPAADKLRALLAEVQS